MHPEELFKANLPLVDRVIGSVCRRAGLRDADAEDFASIARLALIENDYGILRRYEGRAPLGAFLAVVVQRLLSHEWTKLRGRWRASAEAERNGPAAVLLEKLIVRDGRSLDEAAAIAGAIDPSLDRHRARELAARLPPRPPRPRAAPIAGAPDPSPARHRAREPPARLPPRPPRPRLVPLPDDDTPFVAPDTADARAQEGEARQMSERAARVVRETLDTLSSPDRMLLRFHFGAQLSIAEAARLLGVPQRPLYRRVEVLMQQLRGELEREGVGAAVVEDLISASGAESFDFGLRDGKNDSVRHTSEMEKT